MTVKTWAAVSCIVLGACGGGGGGGGGGFAGFVPPVTGTSQTPPTNTQTTPNTTTDPEPGTGSGPGPVEPQPGGTGPRPGPVVTYTYKLAKIAEERNPFGGTVPATVLGLLNSPEFVGYYYAGFLNSQTGNGIFAKSSLESSYVWTFDKAAPPNGEAAASFLPMMFFPGQGGAGVQYLHGRPATAATYESMPIDADWFGASDDVLARLNAMGAQGYCRQSGEWDAPKMALIRQQGASDRCAYEFKAFPRDVMSDSLETLNAMGDRGFVPFTSVASRGTYYVKVSNDSTTYYYYVVDAVMSSDVDWLAQLNTEGAKGGAQYAFVAASGSTPARRVFRIATQCTRTWLCR